MTIFEEKKKQEKLQYKGFRLPTFNSKSATINSVDPKRQTHAVYAAEDEAFKAACAKANIPASRRQASKYRRQRGLAWRAR